MHHDAAMSQVNDAFERKVDLYLKAYLEMNAWSGMVGVFQKGEPILIKGYGQANKEWNISNSVSTKFRLASISKIFTETAILQLHEAGKLNLNDPLSKYVDDYSKGGEITIQQLMEHTAGIPHLNNFPNYDTLTKFHYTIPEIIHLFKSKPLAFSPGTKYQYSNSGYVLLAYIIERVSGLSYHQYLEKNIFSSLGMLDTGGDDEEQILENRASGYMFNEAGDLVNAEFVDMSIKIGGGSLYGTITDLMKFVDALIRDRSLLKNVEQMPNYVANNGNPYFSANGRVQGFCHQLSHWINEDLTIIVLGNHYSNLALPIAQDLFKLYKGETVSLPINYLSRKVSMDESDLKKYEGSYDFGFGPIGVVEVRNGELTYKGPGKPRYDVLIPMGSDRFFYIQNWVILHFKNRSGEEFKTLDWVMGENSYPATRMK